MNSMHKTLLTLSALTVLNGSAANAGSQNNTFPVAAISGGAVLACVFGYRAYLMADQVNSLRRLAEEQPDNLELQATYKQARHAYHKELAFLSGALGLGATGLFFYKKGAPTNKPVQQTILSLPAGGQGAVQVSIGQVPPVEQQAPSSANVTITASDPEQPVPTLRDLIPNLDEVVTIARKINSAGGFGAVTAEEMEIFGRSKIWADDVLKMIAPIARTETRPGRGDATELNAAVGRLVAMRNDIGTLIEHERFGQPADAENTTKFMEFCRHRPKIEAFAGGLMAANPVLGYSFQNRMNELRELLEKDRK